MCTSPCSLAPYRKRYRDEEIAHEVLFDVQIASVNGQNAWQLIEVLKQLAIRSVTDGAVTRTVAQTFYLIVSLSLRQIEADIIKFISADEIDLG
jgi:hypothetical protein